MQDLCKHCDYATLKKKLISGTSLSKHNDFLPHCMKGMNPHVFIGKRSKSAHISSENVNSLSFSTCPYQVLQFGYISVISIFPWTMMLNNVQLSFTETEFMVPSLSPYSNLSEIG